MVRLIMGVKGSGKTKQLIELINNAAKDEPGNVVCIEPSRDMMFDIHYRIRLKLPKHRIQQNYSILHRLLLLFPHNTYNEDVLDYPGGEGFGCPRISGREAAK